MEESLFRNRFDLTATSKDLYELVLAIEADVLKVDEIEDWLRVKVIKSV